MISIRLALVLSFLVCATALAEPPAALSPSAILANYAAALHSPENTTRGASMEMDIQASLPRIKKTGHLRALRKISALGRITYEALKFEGDGTIKNNVIAKYMAAESEAAEKNTAAASIAITPENYKFKYKGTRPVNERTAYVFELTPRKKRVGLFKGELYIDGETYLPLREEGRMGKNPSVFLKKIEFTRNYAIQDGRAVPRDVRSLIETRLVGKAELLIQYRNLSFTAEPQVAEATGSEL